MKRLVVNNKYDNKTLENFVRENFPFLAKTIFYKSLRNKDIKINGKRINENIKVYENDCIEIYIDDKFLYKNLDLDIIYQDDNILIVDKPNEICVNNAINGEPTLQDELEKKYKMPLYPVHRLDRNTSGLVIFAKSEETLQILEDKIKNHEIEKYYKCTVIGTPEKKEAVLTGYLFKDAKNSKVFIYDKPVNGSTKIITKYKLLEKLPENLSVLEVQLVTGKTHQIRAHLAYIGHPILGDGKYGVNKINKKFGKSTQTLDAYKLKFNFKTESGILEYLNNKIFEKK